MDLASKSKHSIPPEKVNKDNSNLWRYSTILFSAMRKENFSKADPAAYMDFCDASGILGGYDPSDDANLAMDIETFKESLSELDRAIFSMYLLGMRQREMEELLDIKQKAISSRLTNIINRFKLFYVED